ncbi:MAG: M20 family metallopeptidase [Tissierellia bacterium]|nr:M20 family metallopeptidase [Tissierellia bacterium]
MIKLDNLIKEIEKEAINHWHYLHAHPELSMKEYNTQKYLLEIIEKEVNYDSINIVGETGIFVELTGKKGKSDKVIALRADMDALPVLEDNDLEFKSKNPGIMHACGHDVHMTILLSSLIILSKLKDKFSGKILFIFQPAEETLEGAKLFLNDSRLDLDQVDIFVGLHVNSDLYAGTIGVKSGAILASADSFYAKVIGKQCHAAHPNRGIDPIVITANIINALQSIVSRNISAVDSGIVTIGMLSAGTAVNIIPEYVDFAGTIRAIDFDTRKIIHKRLRSIFLDIANSMGGEAIVKIEEGSPPLICDEALVKRVIKVGNKIFGKENVIEIEKPSMGGEDFAFFVENKPGVFIQIGARSKNKEFAGVHTPKFYSDPKSIPTGIKTLIGFTLDYLDVDYF